MPIMRAALALGLSCLVIAAPPAQADSWFKKTPKERAYLARLAASAVEYGALDHRQGKYESARKHFERATAYNPDNLSAWTNLGYAYLKLRENQKSEQAFGKALGIGSTDVRANTGLGRALYGQGKYKQALRYLDRAVRHKRDYADARYHRSNAYYHLGRYQEALQDAQRAVKLAPGSQAARDWLTRVQAKVKAGQ